MALSLSLPINIPGVSTALAKLDAAKSAFLAIPARVRAASDRLSRVRTMMNSHGGVTVDANQKAQAVQNDLQFVQQQWDSAAQRYEQLNSLRSSGSSISADAVMIAIQLATDVTYVESHASAAIRAVDTLASQYLSADELASLNVQTYGTAGMSLPLVLGIGAALFLFLRRRK